MEEKRVCDICGREHPLSELKEFDGVLLCESCWNSETIVCEQCGTRIWSDDNEGDGETPLCSQCYDRYYTTCADCGRTIHQNDAYFEDDDDYTARCYSCHCRHTDHRVIHDYYYKPEPIFYGEGNRYFGVELEIDDGGEDNTNAEKIERIANAENELIYIKHDGSLSQGMEIVTYPMSLDFHLHQMPWAGILAKAKAMGYLSHQAGTCGLHVHINRTAFGEIEEDQEAVIARILYFFEKHWEELLKFSRRTQKQLRRWAVRYGLKEHPKQVLDIAKGSQERYTCVNLTNYHTVEFRMFRGTLKWNTLIATLQLLDRICDVAISLSDEELQDMANHIPYGYRIENGVAVIDEGQAEQVRTLFSSYLSGLALVPAAEAAGLTLFHSGAKRMLQNEHYLGDDFYPAIIDSETFSKVAEERDRRAGALGRIRERTTPPPSKAETAFIIGKVTHRYDDPFKQAAYIYSLIESEVQNG